MPEHIEPEPKDAADGAAAFSTAAAAIRYVIVTGLTYAVARGWIDGDNVEGIAAQLTIVVTAVYGLFRTYRKGAKLRTAAQRTGYGVKGRGL